MKWLQKKISGGLVQHLDFDRKMLHIVQGKGGKDRYVPLSEHLIRGLKVHGCFFQTG
ncbi:hypothetical protein SAMN05443429_1021 [Cruoricaptor ignavus]|uniref:Uncharacterized protein n=1 Tax=Cruoricaptor ignavus TaxID=1118202 RepID=A0A1M6BH31_9FLAO|nr:hypothetical protein [Cruoricaptor ignavus]SHI48015.1 hypothetical protein SAMN05443429_1021 [Cruoricaptor ignavus]